MKGSKSENVGTNSTPMTGVMDAGAPGFVINMKCISCVLTEVSSCTTIEDASHYYIYVVTVEYHDVLTLYSTLRELSAAC
eukprot:20003-Heterococcus_DN1.PRE.5